jgi:type IV secretion system protein VirB9
VRILKTFSAALLLAALSTPASADPRIRNVVYSPDKVIRVVGHYGFQMAIEFPEPDRIESVAVGDSLTWQVTPNKRRNVLFIKPVDEGDVTNMTVVTTHNYYTFELIARLRTPETPASDITYVLRIAPPPVEAQPRIDPLPLRDSGLIEQHRTLNERYTYSGSKENLPSQVFDDGVSTTFRWPAGVDAPAIFFRRPDGGESVVNFSYKGDAIVVHQIAREFILRNGKEVTTIFNDGFVEIDRGPDAPKPRSKKKGGLFGLFGD